MDFTQMYSPDDKPSAPRDIIPAGKYEVMIEQVAMKDTKAGGGQYLQLDMRVIAGEFTDAVITERLNLVNQNKQAVDIARGTFAAMRAATGIMNPQQPEEMVGGCLLADVVLEEYVAGHYAEGDQAVIEGRAQAGDPIVRNSNKIKGYKSVGQAQPAAPVAAPQRQQQQQPGYMPKAAAPEQQQRPAPGLQKHQQQAAYSPAGAAPWDRPRA